jgi:predicted aconitase with swiveling domain
MGNEVLTHISLGDESAEAKALLETEEVILRGALKARIPFRDVTDVRAEDGVLAFRWSDRDVRIHVGKDAAKWAEKIRNPKSVLDKLGVKAAQKISVLGDVDRAFLDELQARGADTSRRLRRDSDVIFFAANRKEELARLDELRRSLEPAGAIWVLRPKGDLAISEAAVMAAGKAAGLVDVKVVRLSATHTAEKFVIPTAKRP